MSNKAKNAVKTFVNYLELKTRNKKVESVDLLIEESRELIKFNEWGLALENLLENLNEMEYKLDNKEIDLVQNALVTMEIDPKDWNILQKLT